MIASTVPEREAVRIRKTGALFAVYHVRPGAFPGRIALKLRLNDLLPGGTVVESTSGNTGVGLAIAAAIKGYKTVFVMPDKQSMDKVQLLRAFGARVVITPTAVEPDDPRSYYSVARRIVEETPGSVL